MSSTGIRNVNIVPIAGKVMIWPGNHAAVRYADGTRNRQEKIMWIEKIEASRLNPAAYNPRRDLKPRDKDYEKLKRSIEEFGFVEPVVWNERTGFVVGGHQR